MGMGGGQEGPVLERPARPARAPGRRRRRVAGQAGVYVLLVALSGAMLLPYFWMVSSSLAPDAAAFTSFRLFPEHPRWQNYGEVLSTYRVGAWLLNSVVVAGLQTAGVVATSVLAGYAFGRLRFWGRDALFYVYLGTVMIPGQVTLLPSFLIVRWLGWVDTYQGLIVPNLCAFVGVFLMRQFFLDFPAELEDAARIDGCSRWRVLGQIVLPLSTPAVAALAILAFTGAWNDYLWPLVVVSSPRLYTVQLGLAGMRTEVADWRLLMAAATLSALPLLVLFAFLQRSFVRGIATTAIKG
jgi:multiple sugar transport system permease protein